MSSTALSAVLIGPMAAGKTAVGRELARRRGEPFADLDTLIVETDGRTIPQIFAEDGEGCFRDLEARLLADALATRAGVLSLGGGAPVRPESAALLRGLPVVLLRVDEETVATRLRRTQDRPMLVGEDPMQRWRDITAERMPHYRDVARWVVDTHRQPPAALARRIHDLIREDPPKETA